MHHTDIHHIAVIGAGTMGAGIAQLAAQHGYQTLLYDVNRDVLATAHERISYFINRLAEKGKLSHDEAAQSIARLRVSSDLDDAATAQFVVEAAPERI